MAALAATLLAGIQPPSAQAAAAPADTGFTTVRVSNDTFKAHSEPDIAENPANPNNLVAGSKFFTDPAHYQFKIGTYYSSNAGRSWHDVGLLPGFDTYTRTSDISFAFSPNGSIVYACVLAEDGSRSGIFVSRSKDGGKTWSDPSTVFLDLTGATFSDKPWITVDSTSGPSRGTVYVAWNLDSNTSEFGGDPDGGNDAFQGKLTVTGEPQPGVVVATSKDYGKTFSDPVGVTPFDSHHFALGAIPRVGPDGTLYVAFLTYADVNNQTVNGFALSTSADRGVTFTAPHTIDAKIDPLPNHLPNGTFRNLSLPSFALSQKNGSMILGWADMRNGDADILTARSTDHGKTWSRPLRVNHDTLHNGIDQFQPVLAVAPNGTYTCAWFDRRFNSQNKLIDEEIAQSTDGGRTFGKNLRVTRKSWNPAIDAPLPEGKPSNTFIGDYQGLAVDNNTVHPLWNDTGNGTSQEIKTAVVSVKVFARRQAGRAHRAARA